MSEVESKKSEGYVSSDFRLQTSDLRPQFTSKKVQKFVPLHSNFQGEAFYPVFLLVPLNEFN